MIAANKRSIITLFYDESSLGSHQVKMVLAEKEVPHEQELIQPDIINEDFLELGTNGELPTLVDRDLVLFKPRIILEYLDERFPHPPLMPVYPVDRAKSRLLMHRIEQDWFSVIEQAERLAEAEKMKMLNDLKDELLSFGPIFAQKPYFLSEVFSLVDCYIAPILHRLQSYDIKFNGAGSKAIKNYMDLVFERPCFVTSLKNSPQKVIVEK
ncbi:stringent starvation protein A [Testudinibacter sp. TR-2022]|uniref:glutathione S-transferase N-terminal domain-containing protein n=1 Tax=Testudinibacter sp. TR-2022 TaxID=2585029 RepID=UPI001119752F|nr:glutathione S-transferase N-terminal domain-containing protein [Testudinibacter sp. TR-2022]TNG94504.1 stringent starvation protein A [Pasteurellaceae bacterium UScroc12]TNG97424.1 stringent starvation protein A [Pasteurellaceae bacterium USgator41]TNG98904.1 stringent starvation protein A [Pasteurellaceae bacterium USgator11]TNG99651.1 stringent starvation protein A [Pasteurellaceae bacterium UScroc31]TNH05264.1 stringent starvation protein A [Pasteurellaceae bacterium Phil31]